MALQFIGLICPVVIPILVVCLFPKMSFGLIVGTYAVIVLITTGIRNFLYVLYGNGLNYLLHDSETQLVVIVLAVEQLILGIITIGILTLLRRRRAISSNLRPPPNRPINNPKN